VPDSYCPQTIVGANRHPAAGTKWLQSILQIIEHDHHEDDRPAQQGDLANAVIKPKLAKRLALVLFAPPHDRRAPPQIRTTEPAFGDTFKTFFEIGQRCRRQLWFRF